MPLTPEEKYNLDLKVRGFTPDPSQAAAVAMLQKLHHALVARKTSLAYYSQKMFGSLGFNIRSLNGLYFWGGVGRGKTYLLDLFYDCLPFENKIRLHFHRFMRRVHNELSTLQGVSDPLDKVADNFAAQTEIICFDEMFVQDITDAMLLGRLFDKIFDRGITLVITSNIPPDELYKNGLQRDQFLPAIESIKQHMQVVNIENDTDYRMRKLDSVELYHYPLDKNYNAYLRQTFADLAPDKGHYNCNIDILGREVSTVAISDDVVWFEFMVLCGGPRSQSDYIEIARSFHTVILANIPQLGTNNEDMARRFIALIDELYDRKVKLIVTAAVSLSELYQGDLLEFEFQRTCSRLAEMQSREFLSLPHRP